MSETTTPEIRPVTRTRSEKRKRTEQFRVRLTVEERDALAAAADNAQLDVAAYVRRQTIGQIGARARPRRVAGDLAALAELRAQLGYVGNNLNQLTRLANMGDMDRPEDLDRVLAFLLDLLSEVRSAMRPEAG